LLNSLGVEAHFEEYRDESLHPVKQAGIVAGGKKVGVIGELHPKVLEAFEISEPVYLFEISLPALLPFATGYKVFQPVPRFPATVRDMALVIDAGITNQRVMNIIKSFSLVGRVAIFDVYTGDQVPQGRKSLAYRITYQSPTHTLTDEEVNKVHKQILDRLSQELGAILRG